MKLKLLIGILAIASAAAGLTPVAQAEGGDVSAATVTRGARNDNSTLTNTYVYAGNGGAYLDAVTAVLYSPFGESNIQNADSYGDYARQVIYKWKDGAEIQAGWFAANRWDCYAECTEYYYDCRDGCYGWLDMGALAEPYLHVIGDPGDIPDHQNSWTIGSSRTCIVNDVLYEYGCHDIYLDGLIVGTSVGRMWGAARTVGVALNSESVRWTSPGTNPWKWWNFSYITTSVPGAWICCGMPGPNGAVDPFGFTFYTANLWYNPNTSWIHGYLGYDSFYDNYTWMDYYFQY